MSSQPITWNFGKLESVLAKMNDIADSKRTAFQSRLKNLHRLSFPLGFEQRMGKAAVYETGQIAMMAIAVELTQLGLSPETVVRTLALNWYPTNMALTMGARALIAERPDLRVHDESWRAAPLSNPMFLYFDPMALAGLMSGYADTYDPTDAPDETFFYGGIGVLREGLAEWTSGKSSRISLINVTSLLDRIVDEPFADASANMDYRDRFCREVIAWVDDFEDKAVRGASRGRAKFLRDWIKICVPAYADVLDFDENVSFIVNNLGVPEDAVKNILHLMQRGS